MKKQELIDKTNETIAELVYDKYELQKAYNYYNGKRDPEQFKYLEENFGITVSDEEALTLKTVKDVAEFIERKV